MNTASVAPLLELQHICKTYGSLKANDDISLSVRAGEIHAILGENGAGKSTLMKIIYGYVRPDSGKILINGQEVNISGPSAARKMGIGMVFQHFSLFETLTAAENISLTTENTGDRDAIRQRIRELSDRYGLDIHPDKPIISLSVGERQRVEIIRCLMQNPTLLIMDEPTSVLTPQECTNLFKTLRVFAEEGRAILYISHKLEEIRSLCGRATVLRGGKHIGECDPRSESTKSMAEMMIGKKIDHVHKEPGVLTDAVPCFTVKGLTASSDDPFNTGVKDVAFEVKPGEIFGIAGVAGNGQHMLFSLLSGEVSSPKANMITFNGQHAGRWGVTKRRRKGFAFVPEERMGRGAVPEMTLTENTLLSTHHEKNTVSLGLMSYEKAEKTANAVIKHYDVRTPGNSAEAGSLSGGNLQKFIVGREVEQNPKLLVISAPTWGVDAGAEVFIRQTLADKAKQGMAIILFSQDLDEVMELSDRVAVMFSGRLSPAYPAKKLTQEQIGLLMGGEPSISISQ